mmetsp:Transcript_2906/g.4175  ORF Transcript_2906/g.4175 Transcript_2906/m.4175 type:complete len:327 (+) Transcript_2906:171-1151(+)|eukprot:CAMPEP_0203748852 /NCGR_PEP_ID=MMETSP0098-20131031/3620_1 /ASSEMBLY_ACC=CAM_ASM_000208 /TAXON_ID=96639 /ORGANISM=" , Strain NY0313808BC1" /LENGTH=326 /DNA_ID=CAMNT_0050637739 /DNA_START=1235 /DNA_END=2215 /DNA_ORIENTATION=-
MRRVGACFDIDGVLVRGKSALPGARQALNSLIQAEVPFAFMTNGGGISERQKCEDLRQIIGADIHEEQIVLAHTPMQELAKEYSDRKVMVLGCRNELQVAKEYGFNRVVSPQAYCAQHQDIYPFRKLDPALGEADRFRNDPVEAVIIMHDPVDWHLELQVCIDILLGNDLLSGDTHPQRHGVQRVPVFNSNEDFVFSGAYKHPRFAQGAFLRTLEMLYASSTNGQQLEVGRYGKPHKVTFDFAENLLKEQVAARTEIAAENVEFDRIFLLGDNIHADIKGANAAGEPWHSVLVETGIYQPGCPETMDAKTVCRDVTEAVDMILSQR